MREEVLEQEASLAREALEELAEKEEEAKEEKRYELYFHTKKENSLIQ